MPITLNCKINIDNHFIQANLYRNLYFYLKYSYSIIK